MYILYSVDKKILTFFITNLYIVEFIRQRHRSQKKQTQNKTFAYFEVVNTTFTLPPKRIIHSMKKIAKVFHFLHRSS